MSQGGNPRPQGVWWLLGYMDAQHTGSQTFLLPFLGASSRADSFPTHLLEPTSRLLFVSSRSQAR